MGYFAFNVAVSAAYLVGILVLVRELRISTAEERQEKQSVPLLLASTVAYAVIIAKTYQLAQLCSWV